MAEVVGNVTKEPELRQTSNGQHVATIRIATNRRWQDRNSGEQKERDRISCDCRVGRTRKKKRQSE